MPFSNTSWRCLRCAWIDGINGNIVLMQVILYQIDLGIVGPIIFMSWIPVKYYNLKMLRKVLEAINGSDPDPNMSLTILSIESSHGQVGRRVKIRNILLRHYLILLHWYARILEKISKNPLKIYNDHRSVHLSHSSPKKMSLGSFEIFTCRGEQMHL